MEDAPINLDFDKELVLSLNLGVAMQINKFGVDLRYSTGLSENLASYFQSNTLVSIDTKSHQVTLSISYQLN